MDGDLIVVGFLALFVVLGVGHTWWWAKRENRRLDAEAERMRARKPTA